VELIFFFLEGTDLKDDEDELMARPGMHAHPAKFFYFR